MMLFNLSKLSSDGPRARRGPMATTETEGRVPLVSTPVLMVEEEISLDKLDFSSPSHVDAMDDFADETKLSGLLATA